MAVELATAYINLVPSTRDLASGISSDLIPSAGSAGDAAGAAAGAGMVGSMKKFLGPAVVAGATAGVAKGLYDIGTTFDSVADTIRIGTGATGSALDGLIESARNVGRNVPADFSTIAPVVADLNTRLGLSGETLETVAGQYLEAGRILGQDVDIQGTTAAFSAFGIEGANVEGAMDALFQASQATGVGMNELAGSAQLAAPALKTLGFSFDDSIALVGQFDKAGLNSAQVMAGMSRGLVNLAKDGEEPQAAFQRVVGEIGGFIEAGDQAAALDLASQVFGTRGATQFIDAIGQGALSVGDLTAAIGATSDTILGVGGETSDFAESWQLVKNNALLALEPLGSAVFSGLADIFASMVGPMQTVGTWLGENTWAFGVLAAIVGGVLVVAFVSWAAAAWAATAAMLANPVTWIVIGIMALIAALVLLIANWDSVVAWVSGVWGNIVQWLKDTFASIGTWFTEKGQAIGTFLSGLWSGIRDRVVSIWNNITGFISGIPSKILGFFAKLGDLAGNVGRWFGDVFSRVTEWGGKIIKSVTDIPGKIANGFRNVINLLYNAGANIIRGFLNGIMAAFEGVKDFIGGIGSWIARNKGPKAYDLALLVPAGGWIMEGLERGITQGIPGLKATLGDVAATVAGSKFDAAVTSSAAYAGAAAYAAPTSITVRDADGALIGRMRTEAGAVQSGRISPLTEGRAAW